MERETIERLAIDNALGELNADAAALFETYLAEHTEARLHRCANRAAPLSKGLGPGLG